METVDRGEGEEEESREGKIALDRAQGAKGLVGLQSIWEGWCWGS